MEEKNLSEQIVSALTHFFYNFILYFLFIVPFELWKKATFRLAAQKENGTLKIGKISSLWPFLSFLKSFLFEFLFDAFIFIVYFIGPLLGIYSLTQGAPFEVFLLSLVYVYYIPVVLSIYRDLFQLALLPFRKFLSWASKPAQHLDLKIKNI